VGVAVATLTLLLAAAEPPAAPDASEADLAERARAAFAEGVRRRGEGERGETEFRTAAACYEQLRARGVENPDLYANLGDVYLLADDLGRAILAYRRGLRHAPHDAGLLRRYAAARELVAYPANNPLGRPAREPRPPWLLRIASLWSLLAAFVCYMGTCAAVTRWVMTRRGRWLALAAASLLAAVPPVLLLIDAERRRAAEAAHTLVVIKDDDVLLRKGDGLKYPKRYDATVGRGVEATLVNERQEGKWVQIELAGGEVGWVPRRFVLIDGPGGD
jgi:tetratricopeptide (TPR) repeat protein